MSNNSTLPSSSYESSQDLTALDDKYEEDQVTMNTTTVTTTNLNMEIIQDPKISKNTIWIEQFLTHYYYSQCLQVDSETNKNQIQEIKMTSSDRCGTVIVQDFEIDRVVPSSFEDIQAVLSDILSLKVRYKIVNEEVEQDKVSLFIIKVPPTNSEDRQLAALANVNEREVNFYKKVVPSIQNWCDKKGVTMQVGLAECYHAHYDSPLEEVAKEGLIEDLSKAESTIVLQDLRPQGFGKRHFSEPLTLLEVKGALTEIAKIHAYTWSIQKLSGEPLKKLWPFYYEAEYEAMLYEALLEDGFPLLNKHLRELIEINNDFDAANILQHLEILQKRNLRTVLFNLLTPAEEPSPTCLCHMDFWCDNIFFRQNSDTFNIDCRILDWQMFSIGRPSHDLALLLFTSLSAQTRKQECTNLLEFYLQVFQSIAHKFNLTIPFNLACLQEEFRHSQLLALLQIIASVDLALYDDSTQERLLDALQDLVSADII